MPVIDGHSHDDGYEKGCCIVVEGTVADRLEGVLDGQDEVDAEEEVQEEGGYLEAGIEDLVGYAENLQALFWVLVGVEDGHEFVEVEVAGDVGWTDHLEQSIVGHAGLHYADNSDHWLWVTLQFFIHENGRSNKTQSNNAKGSQPCKEEPYRLHGVRPRVKLSKHQAFINNVLCGVF